MLGCGWLGAYDSIDTSRQQVCLYFSGVDLLDGTPIVDIKPYVPYADCVSHATNGIAEQAPNILRVNFSEKAKFFCERYQQKHSVRLKLLIQECLQQDPRPAYQQSTHLQNTGERIYGMSLLNCNVRWRMVSDSYNEGMEMIRVISIGYSEV